MDKLNTARPMIMHIDLNSCFATIEQQSRPLLRNKPVVIVNRATEHTSIITASYEAKRQGIGVGMKLRTARLLCPTLVALESDPPKYRFVYRKLMAILQDYSPVAKMKSIDEGLIDFAYSPPEVRQRELLGDVGWEIKQRLKDEIGCYMRCNIGIGTNRFLAKTASGLNKPDGLTEITHQNLREVYSKLKLEDLTGIARGFSERLRAVGIATPLAFLDAPELVLERQVFYGKLGRDWYRRLRGWEVDGVDFALRNVGRQFVLDERNLSYDEVLRRFHGLCEDVVAKLRAQGVWAKTIHIYVRDRHGYWRAIHHERRAFHDEATLFMAVKQMFRNSPLPAVEIGVTCSGLVTEREAQLKLFGNEEHTEQIASAIDEINQSWGDHTIHSADTLGLGGRMKRKVPFGSTRYL